MENTTIYLNNQSHGIKVRVYAHETPKFAAILMHGMAEHDGRYVKFATELAHAGGYVMTYNHRGHGSDAKMLGDIESMDALINDAHFVAASLPKHLPKIIIGHSMGSVVARHMMRANKYKSFVIVGTLGKLSIFDKITANILKPLAKASPKSKLKIINYFALSVNDNKFRGEMKNRWLSKNEENVTAFNEDPLSGFKMTTTAIYETLHYVQMSVRRRLLKDISNNPRILFVAGTDDAVASHSKDIYLLANKYRVVSNDINIHMYPGSRHEVLNEENRDDVSKNIIDWINDNE